jgi:MFS family permease
MYNVLILVCGLVVGSLVVLIFARQEWMFYFFAIFFGFAYGGEVPQIPLFISSIGGTKSLAALIGLTLFIGNIGGALGAWLAGELFDISGHYTWAFVIGTIGAFVAFILAFVLKAQHKKVD